MLEEYQKNINLLEIINSKLIENSIDIRMAQGVKGKFLYTKTFMFGFKKEKFKFLSYFFNCFNKDLLFLIYRDSVIVGCYTLRLVDIDVCYLYDFTILEKYRNKGYSKDALLHIFNYCYQKDIKILKLYVDSNNIIAKLLYLKNGFKKVIEE